jgi:hypothetical protein
LFFRPSLRGSDGPGRSRWSGSVSKPRPVLLPDDPLSVFVSVSGVDHVSGGAAAGPESKARSRLDRPKAGFSPPVEEAAGPVPAA